MANNQFLFELGIEEMPAKTILKSEQQLVDLVTSYLSDEKITFDDVKAFSTPRRLAVLINGLADKQPDLDLEVKGPAKKIAQDADGNWTKAAEGFVKGQNATVDDIIFKEIKGQEYVYVKKHEVGKSVVEVLNNLDQVIAKMNFSTMMRWDNSNYSFIRPIRWIVALLNDEIVHLEIAGVKADRITYGHRFLGKSIEINQANDYEEQLLKEFVIVDYDKRKQLIKKQIQTLVNEYNWEINFDSALLEEVTNLVEWPTAFAGSFDEKYLKIPSEVLITSMKDHQKFFYVTDKDGSLLPYFISVRNGNDQYLDNVISGNEKVLTARLEDAMFFYEEDQKHDIDFYVNKLSGITFHDKIGSLTEHMQRTSSLCKILAEELGLNEEQITDLTRASQIYKFDLVSEMVNEFAELQGIMGEKYALIFGENETVAKAIKEHYMPISANGALPSSIVGGVLAIADKLDSLLSFFAANLIPSGSNDPYALRRSAQGIVRIIQQFNWHINLNDLIDQYLKQVQENHLLSAELIDQLIENRNLLLQFINERIDKNLNAEHISKDIIQTVINSNQHDILTIIMNAKMLSAHHDDSNFKEIVESLTRVMRIVAKQEIPDVKIDSSLFENESESQLFETFNAIKDAFNVSGSMNNYEYLMELAPIINEYFEENMIMADNEAVKNNRLQQLSQITNLLMTIGDLRDLVIK